MVIYVPGTEETDQKKQNMSLQQLGSASTTNAANIATINTTLTAIQGAWTAYTPTLTANTGSFTTASASGRYLAVGKTVFVAVTVAITTNGTASVSIIVTLPTSYGSGSYALTGRDITSGKMLQGVTFSTNKMFYVNYDNTYPGANGATHNLSLVYESA